MFYPWSDSLSGHGLGPADRGKVPLLGVAVNVGGLWRVLDGGSQVHGTREFLEHLVCFHAGIGLSGCVAGCVSSKGLGFMEPKLVVDPGDGGSTDGMGTEMASSDDLLGLRRSGDEADGFREVQDDGSHRAAVEAFPRSVPPDGKEKGGVRFGVWSCVQVFPKGCLGCTREDCHRVLVDVSFGLVAENSLFQVEVTEFCSLQRNASECAGIHHLNKGDGSERSRSVLWKGLEHFPDLVWGWTGKGRRAFLDGNSGRSTDVWVEVSALGPPVEGFDG